MAFSSSVVHKLDCKKWVSLLLVLAAILLLPRTSSGQTSDLATAESLFREGRALMQRGEYAKACAALLASSELDRALGTLLNLARCYELSGKMASAWGLYSEVGILAKRMNQAERSRVAIEHRDRIADRVPYVVVTLEGVSDSVAIAIDGKPLPTSALGVPFAIDAGAHQLVASESGKLARSIVFDIPARETNDARLTRVNVPALELLRSAPEAPPARAHQPPPNDKLLETSRNPIPSGSPPNDSESGTAPSQVGRWVAVSALALGLSAAGLGIGLGLDAADRAERADCDANDYCSPRGLETRRSARKRMLAANVIGVAGAGLALSGAAALVIVEWQTPRSTVTLSSSLSTAGLGLSFDGHF